MKKVLVWSTLILLFAAIAALWGIKITRQSSQEIHYHAGFLVYVDGKLQDFSGIQYMNVKPCVSREVKEEREDAQLEKAHLHDGVGDVVHVEALDATWEDLFTNIGFQLPKDKIISVYADGVSINNFRKSPIKPYQSVIVVVGDGGGIDLSKYVAQQRMIEVEKKGETCGV